MQKNKILCIIFAVIICFVFCSCESGDTSETSASAYESTVTSLAVSSEETVLSEETASSEEAVSSEIISSQNSESEKVSSLESTVSKKQTSKTSSASATSQKKKEDNKYPYLLSVNRKQNVVTVYKKDGSGKYTVPVKAMVCSCGKSGGTPTGTFQTQNKYDWRALVGNVYGQYATRITGSILFHSVPYFKRDKSTLEYEEYNKLGTAASLGCVRLTVADAKWIYDNCALGTTVKIYDGDEKLPLGKPTAQKIDVKSENRGWDPTDPDSANPWKKTPASSSSSASSETSSEKADEETSSAEE